MISEKESCVSNFFSVESYVKILSVVKFSSLSLEINGSTLEYYFTIKNTSVSIYKRSFNPFYLRKTVHHEISSVSVTVLDLLELLVAITLTLFTSTDSKEPNSQDQNGTESFVIRI